MTVIKWCPFEVQNSESRNIYVEIGITIYSSNNSWSQHFSFY